MKRTGILIATCASLAFSVGAVNAAISTGSSERVGSEYQTLEVTRLVGDLENPWALAFLPDGGLLVTERPGRLKLLRDDEATEISGLPDDLFATNQGGLLDVVLHPDYETNGWIYFTYSKGSRDATATTLFRARLDGDELVDREQLFTQDRQSQPGRHYGSRLAFLPDGTLLMSIGDRGVEPERAQDLGDHAGSLLRLNDDGSVPSDNPFVNHAEALPEIYSYGHRNIQGLIVHPETDEIWATEHGARGADELNRVEAGKNYGWPVVSLSRDYRTQEQFGDSVRSQEGMEDPHVYWTPALAASGLAFHDGDGFASQWEGNLFAGGLLGKQVRRIVFEDGEVVHQEELLRDEIGRVRDVRVGPDGSLYVVTDESDGGVYRVRAAD